MKNKIKLKIVFSIAILFITLAVYYKITYNDNNFTCKSNIVIKNEGSIFYGILDYNVSQSSGIVNINGHVKKTDGAEFVVNRTIIFASSIQGNSTVWTSTNNFVANTDTASSEVLRGLFPKIYLTPASISDVNIERIGLNSFLLARENIPYVYCKR